MEKLIQFASQAEADPRVGTAHISLYLSLFNRWVQTQEQPVSFSRAEIMSAAKISSRATYHRCINDLHAYGYIQYIPSHHPVLGSIVFFLPRK